MSRNAGRLVLVVGPSGAGKDTLLAHAAQSLESDPRFVFPKRQVTRQVDELLEDHDPLSREEFDRLHGSGKATLSWEAHGLGYVIPASVGDQIAEGRIAVCNGSRRVLPEAKRKYPDCEIILIDAARDIRAERLAARKRETPAEVAARLDREARVDELAFHPVLIDNSGDLNTSVATMCAALRQIAAAAANSA